MKKNFFILLILVLSLSGCSENDCPLGSPCHDAALASAASNINYDDSGIEINECAVATVSIQNEYSEKINDATDLVHLNIEPLTLENAGFWDNYNLHINDLKVSFESEGGDLEALEKKIFLWGEEMQVKIDELVDSSDIESQEFKDKARLLHLESVEGIVELISAGGSETEVLAIQFLEWFKENKQNFDEVEHKVNDLYNMLDLEIERLNNERDTAIGALNC